MTDRVNITIAIKYKVTENYGLSISIFKFDRGISKGQLGCGTGVLPNFLTFILSRVIVFEKYMTYLDKSISKAGPIQVEAILQEHLSDHLHFRQLRSAETLINRKMNRGFSNLSQ